MFLFSFYLTYWKLYMLGTIVSALWILIHNSIWFSFTTIIPNLQMKQLRYKKSLIIVQCHPVGKQQSWYLKLSYQVPDFWTALFCYAIILDPNRFVFLKQRHYGLLFMSIITNLIHYLTVFQNTFINYFI